jgi:hypothetical protein
LLPIEFKNGNGKTEMVKKELEKWETGKKGNGKMGNAEVLWKSAPMHVWKTWLFISLDSEVATR